MPKSLIATYGRFVYVVLALSAALLLCSLKASAATEKVLYTFQGGSDGGYPNGDLVFDDVGNLYGTTSGGAFADGIVFELSPDGSGNWVKSTIYTFLGEPDGATPLGGLTFDSTGNLYGTTVSGGIGCNGGCGTVFELSPNGSGTWTEKIIYAFLSEHDGWQPWGKLVFDSLGNLFGVTNQGGPNFGTVFELSPKPNGSWTKQTILNLGDYRGEGSVGDLVMDSADNLFGTTKVGGNGSGGTVFQLVPGSAGEWTSRVLHSFVGGQDGLYPSGGLILDAAGNLYGDTLEGGSENEGTVFELQCISKNNWKEKIIHTFSRPIGGQGPVGILTLDAFGNLYGVTSVGGTVGCIRGGCGLAYELSPHSGYWSERVLTDFSVVTDGGFPSGGLTMDTAGNLYGATAGDSGTVAPYGTVFEITP